MFTAQATVVRCATYHIKLAIADVGDALYSSAVFLKANSFNAGDAVQVDPVALILIRCPPQWKDVTTLLSDLNGSMATAARI